MAKSKLVGLLFEAWNDMDRVLANLEPDDAVQKWDGGSSFAWTLAHVTRTMDNWINVRFQKLAPHGYITEERFGFGGSGAADNWDAIQKAVREIRETARTYLETMTDDDLDLTIPYDGSRLHLRQDVRPLRHALLRNCAHHYFHIGEVATKRDRLGHEVGDYPGLLEECI